MSGLSFRERLIDPRSPDRRPRRAAYVLPTLFTSGNIFLGFIAILQAFEGALQAQSGDLGPNAHFAVAAKSIGFAVFFDGLDGRIARMTNTVSDFGRELDSLADVITFGIAPAVLLFVWGVLFVVSPLNARLLSELHNAGYFVAFFYLLSGAVRLARFNVQTNPKPSNPGRPDRKYFVGMPIPSAAGFIAAVVYFVDSSSPIRSYVVSIAWLITCVAVALLMVSTWRYPSFKQLSVAKPRSPVAVLLIGGLAILIFVWSQPVLLILSSTYLLSGILIRIGGLVRRRLRPRPPTPQPEHQVG